MSVVAAPAAAVETAGAADPSMEDILASIRRILSEDEPPAAAGPVPLPEAAATPEEEVLELDASMIVPATPAPNVGAMSWEPPALAAPLPAQGMFPAEAPAPEPLPAVEMAAPAGGLLAGETERAALASVSRMMRSLQTERQTPVYRGGPTLEDITLTLLRPLVKDWLDQNLPPIVERMVRLEIERLGARALDR